ncbi:hypothetical protein D3C72_1403180 [compost metagenome]
MAYLKGHDLTRAVPPEMKWKNDTAIITFVSGKSERTVDYSQIEKKQAVVNGKTISIPADALFSEGVKKMREATKASNSKKNASFGFPFINQAMAQMYLGGPADAGIMDAITYYSGIDGLMACIPTEEKDSNEDCPFKSDTTMMKSIFDEEDYTLLELDCKNEKLNSIVWRERDVGKFSFQVIYDKYGVARKMELLSYQNIVRDECFYELDADGKLFNSVYDSNMCAQGRAEGDYKSGTGVLNKGDKPRSFTRVPASVTRMQKCCASTECRGEMNRKIAADKATKERARERVEEEESRNR